MYSCQVQRNIISILAYNFFSDSHKGFTQESIQMHGLCCQNQIWMAGATTNQTHECLEAMPDKTCADLGWLWAPAKATCQFPKELRHLDLQAVFAYHRIVGQKLQRVS